MGSLIHSDGHLSISGMDIWLEQRNKDCIGFAIQLSLNAAWSVIFFGLQNPFLAFIEMIFMWFAILATIVLFYRITPTAAYLLIPYIFWVSFASVLNFAIWRLN